MNPKCCWCPICSEDLGSTVPDHLEQLLPEGHCHRLCVYSPQDSGFTASLKLQLSTREEAHSWLKDFQRSSRVTLRVQKTYPVTEDSARRNGYRVDMRCQHNTRQKGSSKRNTHCPAGLYLVLKKPRHSQNRKSRSSDAHIQQGFLLHVTIKHHHNHHLACAALQQHHVDKLEELFQNGHSPSSALSALKCGLQEQQGDASADPPVCPDIFFCHRLYQSMFRREGGAASPQGSEGHFEMTSPHVQSESLAEDLEARLRSVFESLMDKLKQDQTFRAPVESFVSNYERLQTDGGLVSALCSFGTRDETQPRKGLSTQTVQSTARRGTRCRTRPGARRSLTGRAPKREERAAPQPLGQHLPAAAPLCDQHGTN